MSLLSVPWVDIQCIPVFFFENLFLKLSDVLWFRLVVVACLRLAGEVGSNKLTTATTHSWPSCYTSWPSFNPSHGYCPSDPNKQRIIKVVADRKSPNIQCPQYNGNQKAKLPIPTTISDRSLFWTISVAFPSLGGSGHRSALTPQSPDDIAPLDCQHQIPASIAVL